VVARHLGQFNGAYLMGEPLPYYPWLSSQWLRSCLAQAAPAVAQLPEAVKHSLVRRVHPPERVDRILPHWAERDKFLDRSTAYHRRSVISTRSAATSSPSAPRMASTRR
jgi:hypothetical protein